MSKAVIYIGTKINSNQIATGFHGYVYDEIVEKNNSHTPNSTVISDKGYYPTRFASSKCNFSMSPNAKDLGDPLAKLDRRESLGYVNPIGYIDGNIKKIVDMMNNHITYAPLIEMTKMILDLEIGIDDLYIIDLSESHGYYYAREQNDDEFSKFKNSYQHVLNISIREHTEFINPAPPFNPLPIIPEIYVADLINIGLNIKPSNKKINYYKEVKNYWKYENKNERHLFLKNRQIYFSNSIRENLKGKFIYGIMKYGADEEPGRKMGEPLFGIAVLPEEPTYIESIIKLHQAHLGTMSLMLTMDLNVAYHQRVLFCYDIYGADIFTIKNKSLYAFDTQPLIETINPPGLAKHAVDKLFNYELFINSFLTEDKLASVEEIDITSHFFKPDAKGKLSMFIGQADINVTIPIDSLPGVAKLTLTLGHHLPERNHIKRLESLNPKIVLLVDKIIDETYYEFYVYVEFNIDGTRHCSLWNNPYTSRIFFKLKNKIASEG